MPSNSLLTIKKTLKELGAKRVGTEPGFEAMKQQLVGFITLDASNILWKFARALEVEVIRKVCKAKGDAIKASFESLRPGLSKREFLKSLYLNLIEKSGCYLPAFCIVRSSPEECKMISTVMGHKIIKKGELILIDTGATYREYSSDMIRMACVGKPTEKQKKFFELAREAQLACIDLIKPGIKACDIFNEGKRVFEKAGLKKGAYLRYCGHGLGIGGYNPPILNAFDETLIEEGMILCVEPQCWDARAPLQ